AGPPAGAPPAGQGPPPPPRPPLRAHPLTRRYRQLVRIIVFQRDALRSLDAQQRTGHPAALARCVHAPHPDPISVVLPRLLAPIQLRRLALRQRNGVGVLRSIVRLHDSFIAWCVGLLYHVRLLLGTAYTPIPDKRCQVFRASQRRGEEMGYDPDLV